jgi:release factor glutamine methyltransferase
MLQTATVGWVSQLTEAGITSHDASVEVRQLILETLGLTLTQLLLHDGSLSAADSRRIDARIARRATREPLAYILGERWFYGMRFLVTPDVLIPRPETELLAELALEHLQQFPTENPSILDLCTGSGCVGIAILANYPAAAAVLTDLSPDATAIAWQNAELHGVFERCQLIVGDLDSDIATEDTFDVITANPPYIDPDDIETLDIEVRDWEPELALYASDAGYALYPRIAALALNRLRPGGLLAVECGHTQAGTIADMFAAAGLTNIKIHDDLAGIPRVVTANQL